MKKFWSVCKSVCKRCKRLAFAFAAVLGLVTVSKAQDTAQSYDITIVGEIGDRLEATLTSFWSSNATIIYISVGLIVATALTWMVVRFFLKGTRRA